MITAIFLSALFRIFFNKVVLPAPKYPVIIEIGFSYKFLRKV